MNALNTRKIPLWLPALLVAVAAWAVAALLFNRTSWLDWSQPVWLEGDPLEVYARVKIASEQPGASLVNFTQIDRLGAPLDHADWSAYPVPDKLVFVLTGLLARLTGLIAAVQLVSIAFLSLNALSFYLTARTLRWRWEWAAALALAFAFCNFNVRWGITLSLSQSFTFPPLILLCARATRRHAASPIHRGWHLLAALLGVWLGLGNPYLAYFAGILGGGALVLGLVRRSPRSRLALLAVFLGVLSVTFLASNAAYAWQQWHLPGAGALIRNRGDFATYALRPIDWFVPPADHRLDFMAGLGRSYLTARRATGEFFYNYLGLLGIAAGLGLLVACVQSLRKKRIPSSDVLLGLAWITAFGIYGGINTWIGEAGIDLFRASTRIGVFALIWLFFFIGGRLNRVTRRLPFPVSLALACALAALACWEQTPPLSASEPRQRNAARWRQYERLTDSLEQSLPPGASIFQLPTVPFPEAGRTGTMEDYEHFLPYLTSKNLRFSYGYLRSAPVARWASFHSTQPANEFVATLEQTGFAALWIDDRGYADGAVELVAKLRNLGLQEIRVPSGLPIHLFQLTPAIKPGLPDLADHRLESAWDDRAPAPKQAVLLALNGWYAVEKENQRSWRWAQQVARAGIWWDQPSTKGTLSFRLDGRSGTQVSLKLNEREIARWPIGVGPNQQQKLEIPLQPGLNTLEFTLIGRTFRPGGNDPRHLGFMIENLSVSAP